MSRRGMTRRDVVRGTVGGALVATLLGPSALLHAQEQASTRSKVVISRDQAVTDDAHEVDVAVLEAMLGAGLVALTGKPTAEEAWASLFQPGDVVGLVGTNWMNPTHGELGEVVAKGLVGAGVKEVDIRPAQGSLDKVEPCTALICMPALKAHWLTGIGTVIKNYILFSGKPSAYHKEDSAKLGEIWQLDGVAGKTRLCLVDALRPLCGKGPQVMPKYLWDYKGLLLSADPVAADAVGLRLMEARREIIRGEPWPISPPAICIEAAETVYGLGVGDLARIDVEKIGWQDEALI